MAVADGAEGLDAEEEGAPEIARRHGGDAVRVDQVEAREDQVEHQEGGAHQGQDAQQRQGQHPVIDVGEGRAVAAHDDRRASAVTLDDAGKAQRRGSGIFRFGAHRLTLPRAKAEAKALALSGRLRR